MKKAFLLMVASLAAGTAIPSCIFTNDPVQPNSPPQIISAFPEEPVLVMQALTDTIRFTLEARDPDFDEITYRWVFLDRDGSVDSTTVTGCNSYTFGPAIGGYYHIQGRAHDGIDYAVHDWYVTVIEEHNEPPEIVWRAPDQDSISVLIGDSLEFMIGVEDDHPEDLRYTYYVGDEGVKVLEPTPELVHRFMDSGIFDVKGIVSDGEFADTTMWAVRVTGDPDTMPPGPITDLRGWTGTEPGTVLLRWTAPGDDGYEGTARYYRVRTAAIPILTEDRWDDAFQQGGAPVPGPAGTIETMTALDLDPGTWLYVTVRAVDEFGNMSSLGNCIRLLVRGNFSDGIVLDALTGLPVEGALVSAGGICCTTGADGRYVLFDLPLGTNVIYVKDEQIAGELGEYYDLAWNVSGLGSCFTLDLPLLPAFGLEAALSDIYDNDFLEFLKYLTNTRGLVGRPTIWRNWDHFPLTVYNPQFTWEGVDIQAVADQAMFEWESRTGLELFVETGDSATADVVITYDLEQDRKHHVETIATNPDGTPQKMEVQIYPINTLSPINIKGLMIFAHEFGHVLVLFHSYDLGHLMVGMTAPLVSVPTIDEVRLIQVLHSYPIIFDTSQIIKE